MSEDTYNDATLARLRELEAEVERLKEIVQPFATGDCWTLPEDPDQVLVLVPEAAWVAVRKVFQ